MSVTKMLGDLIRQPMLKIAGVVVLGGMFLTSTGRAAVVATPASPTQTPTRIVPQNNPQRVAPSQRVMPDRTSQQQHETPDREVPEHRQITRNPHLHAAPETKAMKAERFAVHLREDMAIARDHAWHAWHHHWDYVLWTEMNFGRGSIRGVVRDSSGQSVAGARVWLRDSADRTLRSLIDRHTTHSDENGNFVIRHVHRGVYRVRATVGTVSNSSNTVMVRPGVISFAMVHM